KAPELGVKNASAEGSTYRPDWVPEDAKKDDTFAKKLLETLTSHVQDEGND
ncbi:MAG: LAO/AO transport system ATPase, partial [Veillonella sp. DORA_A_3_16_22]